MSGLPEKKMSGAAQNVDQSIGIENPEKIKLCECGCGQRTQLIRQTKKRCGHIKGEPARFINHHNLKFVKSIRRGEKSPFWKGGIRNGGGRPKINSSGKFLSVFKAEKALGKTLPPGTHVHHFDCDTANNQNNNLIVCENQKHHFLLHRRKRAYDACGNASWKKCCVCKKYDDPNNIHITKTTAYHKKCMRRYSRELYLRRKNKPG